jgi:hypothetical protein
MEIEVHFMYVDAEIIIDAKVAAIDSRLSNLFKLFRQLSYTQPPAVKFRK